MEEAACSGGSGEFTISQSLLTIVSAQFKLGRDMMAFLKLNKKG
jgi:hypothetical protein